MSELQGFPMVSQLDAPTSDGRPSENKWFDCVPASIAAGLIWLTGQQFNPDQLKDAAYGEAWANEGTAASAYVGFCDQQGVSLFSRSDGDLIDIAHAELSAGHPVIFTEVDDYAPPGNPDWTHVCVWYKDRPGFLTAMDPFIAQPLEYDDATWRQRMRAGDVWVMRKKSMVPNGWRDDGTTLVAPNNIPVKMGFRNFVLNNPWDSGNIPLEAEHGADPVELSNPGLGAGTKQRFRTTTLEWTPKMGVFVAWTGQELIALEQKIAQLEQQVQPTPTDFQALKAKLSTAEQNVATLDQAIKDVIASIPAPAQVS